MAVSVHKWLLNKFRDINHSRMDKHIDIIAKNSGKSKAYICLLYTSDAADD